MEKLCPVCLFTIQGIMLKLKEEHVKISLLVGEDIVCICGSKIGGGSRQEFVY